ncbi:MAG: hypothetical protein ACRD5M_12215 [Candidatus Acidiferrales bacterium]
MHTFIDPYWWTLALSLLVQLTLFIRALYRRMRIDDINRAFIRDIATKHLPEIYDLLEKLCERQGIVPVPRPPIFWVDLGKSGL